MLCPPLGRCSNSPVECWLLQLTALPWSRKLTLRMTLRPWSSGIAFPGDGEWLPGLPAQRKPAINDTDIGVKIPSPLLQDAPEKLVGSGWGWTSMKPTTVLKVLPLPYSRPPIAWQVLPLRSNSLKKSHVQESLSWALLLGNTTEDVLLCLLEYIYQGSISRKIYRKKAKLSSYSLSSCLPFLGILSDRFDDESILSPSWAF